VLIIFNVYPCIEKAVGNNKGTNVYENFCLDNNCMGKRLSGGGGKLNGGTFARPWKNRGRTFVRGKLCLYVP